MTLPLHAAPAGESLVLLASVTLAGMGTALLLGVAFAAFVQRRSRPYLLLVAAFAALFARSLVAGGTILGLVSGSTHHLLEHGIDVVLVALVVAAVYYARSVTREVAPS